MATHSSILAWRIPWTEEPGGLQSTGSQRMSETYQVSRAEGIGLPEDMPQKKFDFIMHTQSEAATSSLRRDVEAKRPAEIDAFSGAILRKAAKAGIPVPVMERYHRELEEIIASCS